MCFARTGAPVPRPARPSSFEPRKIDERFACTGGYFFGAAQVAFGPGVAQLKQAPRYPVALVLALEREVMDGAVAVCYRCYAWWHLLAVWASLRFDDHRGLPPSSA